MVKNVTFNLYAITISLPPEFANDPPKYATLHDKLRRGTKSSCYVIEHGKEGNHLHYHSFLHFHKDTRKDHLTTKVKKNVKSIFDIPELNKHMILVKPAYNPIYWIENYLTKESVPVTFDMDLTPYLQRAQYYAVAKLGRSLIPLHQGNFELAIRTFDNIPKEEVQAAFIQQLETNLDEAGYQTKIFRSQTSFVHKTILKIYFPGEYQRSISKSIEKLISPL